MPPGGLDTKERIVEARAVSADGAWLQDDANGMFVPLTTRWAVLFRGPPGIGGGGANGGGGGGAISLS